MTAQGDGTPQAARRGDASALRPRAAYDRPIRRIVVLHRGVSPTTDIYLRPGLRSAACPVNYHDIRTESAGSTLEDGSFVVVVRYLNVGWVWALRQARSRLSGVAYLMDDDIPGAGRDPGLPADYRRAISLFWTAFGPVVNRLSSEAWVTSAGLERTYGGPDVHRMDPVFVGSSKPREFGTPDADEPVRIFYHGGRTHGPDQQWLRDVIAGVQERRETTLFEIMGDGDVARLYGGVPRCRVLQRMPWRDYLSYAAGERFDIGLAPAVPGTYNAARSFNKAYDITRTGAAGVYADVPSFREFVRHDHEGLLAPADDREAWVAAILALVDDPARRERLYTAAFARAHAITERELAAPLLARFRASGDPSP